MDGAPPCMRWRGPDGPSALARRLPDCRTPRDPHRHRAPVVRVGFPARPPFRSHPRGGPASVVRAVLLPIAGHAQGLSGGNLSAFPLSTPPSTAGQALSPDSAELSAGLSTGPRRLRRFRTQADRSAVASGPWPGQRPAAHPARQSAKQDPSALSSVITSSGHDDEWPLSCPIAPFPRMHGSRESRLHARGAPETAGRVVRRHRLAATAGARAGGKPLALAAAPPANPASITSNATASPGCQAPQLHAFPDAAATAADLACHERGPPAGVARGRAGGARGARRRSGRCGVGQVRVQAALGSDR
jgi:hypothetical protein